MTEATTVEKREPVKYTVLERSLVGNKIYEEGETAEYDGLPAENLAPQCEVGKARYQEYLDTNKARVAKMIEMNQADASGLGDAAAFGKMFLEALAESNKEHAAQMEAFRAAQADMIAQAVAGALATAFPNGVGAPSTAWTPPKPAKAAKADKATETSGDQIA
jgi:hypothetical protein